MRNMMAFFTRRWPKLSYRLLTTLILLWLEVMPATHSGLALAGEIVASNAQIYAGDDGFEFVADFDINLGNYIEDALEIGVPLFFNLDLQVTRARWYWLDENVAHYQREIRLSYNALTREYRIGTGGLGRNFDNLRAALTAISRFGALRIADKNALQHGKSYQCTVTLSLDHNQLPKPLQVDAIANRDWNVDSVAYRWVYKP